MNTADKTIRQQLGIIEVLRKKSEEMKDENDLLRNINLELDQRLSKMWQLKERAELTKEMESKIVELSDEVRIVRDEKEALTKQVEQLKFKAFM
jgi:hypothetical protein